MAAPKDAAPNPDGGDIDRPEQDNVTWISYVDANGDRKRITVAEYVKRGL